MFYDLLEKIEMNRAKLEILEKAIEIAKKIDLSLHSSLISEMNEKDDLNFES